MIPTAELLRNMLSAVQDSLSPTCFLDDSDSELSLPLPKKPKKTLQRLRWGDEKLEPLIKCLASIKADYDFRGLDLESDLVKLYSNVRAKMAEIYDKNGFEPLEKTFMRNDMTTEDIAKRKLIVSEKKKLIKQGYLHIKENIKNVMQDYRNAIAPGRRSGSGKFVHFNWNLLKELLGGSPATNCIQNACSSLDDGKRIWK